MERLRSAIVVGVGVAMGLGSASPAIAQTKPVTSLARFAPSENLVGFVEFDGLDAHEQAWKASAAFKVLNETTLGVLLEDIARQLLEKGLPNLKDVPTKPTSSQVIASLKFLAKNGFALAVYGESPRPPHVMFVFRNASTPEGVKATGFVPNLFVGAEGTPPTSRMVGTRKVFTKLSGSWWAEGPDLVFAPPPIENTDAILAVLDGKSPSAQNHAILADLRMVENEFTPAVRGFVDFAKFPPMPPDAAKLGLDGIHRLDLRAGFQDDAIVTSLRMIAPSPRRGILAMLDQAHFDAKTLPPLPAGQTSFAAMSLDLNAMFGKTMGLLRESGSPQLAQMEQMERAIPQILGLQLRDDILAHIGPKMAFYSGAGGNFPLGGGLAMQIPKITIVGETDDAAAFTKALDAIMNVVIAQMKNPPPGAQMPTIRPLADKTGYEMILPPQMAMGPFAGIRPSIVVGKGGFAISTTKADAAKAITTMTAPSPGWTPPPGFEAMVKRLPGDMVLLTVNDPRETVPDAIASLPQLVPVLEGAINQARARAGQEPIGPMVELNVEQVPTAESIRERLFPGSMAVVVNDGGMEIRTRDSVPTISSPAVSGVAVALLLPAVQAAREAARRTQCTNNLKQIGLALHNYESANSRFPGAAIRSKDGKPLLSWRVAILPYIEENALYEEFHLDEPWDSPHNKTLIDRMPKTYFCPSRSASASTTSYRGFTGEGAVFGVDEGARIADFTDGTSNTIFVAEFKEPVIWTQPDDLPLEKDPAKLAAALGSPHPGGFNALFADGSVRFLKSTINRDLLRALLTKSAGEIITNIP